MCKLSIKLKTEDIFLTEIRIKIKRSYDYKGKTKLLYNVIQFFFFLKYPFKKIK